MKICFCIGSMGPGGAEKVVSLLANYFSELGHQIFLIEVSKSMHDSFYNLNPKIRLIKLCPNSKKRSFINRVIKLRRVLKDVGPDCIISFLSHINIYSYFASRNINTKLIVCERNNPATTPKNLLLRKLRNFVFKRSDGCVFQTNEAKNYFGKRCKASLVVENPVSLTTPKKRFENKIEKTIVLVGSNKPEKNRKMAYRAFAIVSSTHPDYTLEIYGQSSYLEDKELLKQLGIEDKTNFHGNINDWHNEAINSTAFILTSDYEGFPNALLESAAMQLPCVATDSPIGGPREILKNGKRGILVKCGDYQAAANSILKIIENRDFAKQLSESNKETLNEYSIQKIGQKWLDYINRIINL